MVAVRIARDVEDAMFRVRGGVWNGFRTNHTGTRVMATIVRGEPERYTVNRPGGTEGNGTNRREGPTTASSVRGSTTREGDNRGRMVRNLPYPEYLKKGGKRDDASIVGDRLLQAIVVRRRVCKYCCWQRTRKTAWTRKQIKRPNQWNFQLALPVA